MEAVVIAKRDKAAALKLLKRIIKRYGRPRLVVTDALRAYSTAKDDIGAADRHQVGHRLNNRAENSHQRRSLVPLRGDYRVQHLAFMVDGASKVAELAVDLHERLASRAGESHPHALPEPYVTLSSHTAPDVRPFACRKRQWAKR